ncbi:MAG: CapA family protein [Planctomycetota bacterium]
MAAHRPVRLAIGGDVSLAGRAADEIAARGGAWLLAELAPRLDRADLMTFNWESPVLPAGREPPEKGLVVPEDRVAGVVDPLPPVAVTVANNHVFDAGAEGVAATARTLDELGVAHVGAGATEAEAAALRTVTVRGVRVGFLGRAEDCPQLADVGFPGPAMIAYPRIVEDVRDAAAQCDALVVHLHHGVEFVDWPAPHFVALCRELIDAGAAVVVGGHPHVPQGHESHGAGHVFYCLGNLAFEITDGGYQNAGSPWTTRSAVALVPLDAAGAGEPEFVPYHIEPAGRPAPAIGPEAREILEHLDAVSADLADDDAIQHHWRDTARRYLGIYINWARGTLDENDWATDDTLCFFRRLPMNESRAFVQELFADADWPRRLSRPPWT